MVLGGPERGRDAGPALLHPNEVARRRVGFNQDLEPKGGVVGRGQRADLRSRAVPGAVAEIIYPEQRRKIECSAGDARTEQASDAQARASVRDAVPQG